MQTPSNLTHTASDLLSYEPFIRSIARSLISNEDQIGDVVQETWLRALKKPSREAGSIKSWLGRVTRNLALDQKRREGARKTREVAAARDESVLDDEKDLTLHSKIVEGVLTLEEPYKSVVILHYYRGMKLAEVARKLDRNSATVRSQLKRAHDMLRGKLDSDYGGDRATWMALCVPLASKHAGVSASGVAVKVAVLLMVAAAIVAGSRAWMDDSNANIEHETAVLAGPEGAQRVNPNSEIAATRELSADRTALSVGEHILVTLDGEPVEGADVWCLDATLVTQEAVETDPSIQMDVEKLFATLGTHVKSDKDGMVQLERPGGEFALLAAKGSYRKTLGASQTTASRIAIELEKVAAIYARVLDQSNEPVSDVPVVICATSFDPPQGMDIDSHSFDMFTRRTDSPTGVAVFRGIEELSITELDGVPRSGLEFPWGVRLRIPGLESQVNEARLHADSDEPVVLRLPPTGSLIVRSVDTNGKTLLVPGSVTVQGVGGSKNYLTEALVDGVARFPFVAVGSQLEVTLAIPELGVNRKRDCGGPAKDGGTRTLNVHRPASAELTGQLVSPTGEPLADAKVRLSVFDEDYRKVHWAELKTDATGAFSAEVRPELIGNRVRITVVRYGSAPGVAVAELEDLTSLSPSTTDLGVVHLRKYRRGITGRCVDTKGSPLAGIELTAQQLPGFDGSGATTNAKGRFSLPGIFPDVATINTRKGTDLILPEPHFVGNEQHDIELVLIQGGSIDGAIAVSDEMEPGQVTVLAYDESQTSPTGISYSALTSCDAKTGAFTLSGLRSGFYRIEFWLNGVLLGKLDRVEVVVSESSNDPRVELVDLLESTESVHFRIVDSAGKPARVGSAVGYALADGKQIGMAINERGGGMNILFKSSPDALIYVSRSGCRGVFLTVEEATGDIVLEPGIPVELNTLQRLKMRRGESTYTFSLRRIEDDPRHADLQRSVGIPSALMKSGTASVRFPAPGRYELCYSRQKSAGSGGLMVASADTSVPSTVEGEFVIEVPESSTTVSIDVTLPEKLPE